MYRTNSSRLNHVADGESLDGLVLGRASRAVAAADGVDVAAALLVAAVVLSLQVRAWSAFGVPVHWVLVGAAVGAGDGDFVRRREASGK